MNPITYKMLDLDGLDLADVKGKTYPGLYNKIYLSLNACQEVILCNWFVAGILIPPTYCDIDISTSGTISFNDMIFIHSDDTIEIPTMGTTPKIVPFTATENGTYEVSGDTDGYSPVTVNVPPIEPVISSLSVNENGIYSAPAGIDGYSPITVSVPGYGVLNIHSGRLDIRDGAIEENESYYYTDFINISNYRGYWFIDIARSDVNSYYTGICFYNNEDTAIEYIRQYSPYRDYSNTNSSSPTKFRITGRVNELQNLSVIHLPSNLRIFGVAGTILISNN